MADGDSFSAETCVPPKEADQVLICCMVWAANAVHVDENLDDALALMRLALPLVSTSSRMQALRPAAEAVLQAQARRGQVGRGATDWMLAMHDMRLVLSADGKRGALARIRG